MRSSLKGLAVAAALWAGASMAEQVAPIPFNGVDFTFHSIVKINNGWSALYAPFGQDPTKSRDEIIVNYFDAKDGGGNPITAEGMASGMVSNIKEHGGTTILPFAVPDPTRQGALIYYVTSYYVYPQDGNGDIWRAKVLVWKDRVVGLLVKHQVDGTGAQEIETNIRAWLVENLQSQGPIIDAIQVPPEPAHGG